MTFEETKETMKCNGYAYFDRDAFINKTDAICYIPENADGLEDCFNYDRLLANVKEFKKDNPSYFTDNSLTIEDVLNNMFNNIEWTFPSTYLADLIN